MVNSSLGFVGWVLGVLLALIIVFMVLPAKWKRIMRPWQTAISSIFGFFGIVVTLWWNGNQEQARQNANNQTILDLKQYERLLEEQEEMSRQRGLARSLKIEVNHLTAKVLFSCYKSYWGRNLDFNSPINNININKGTANIDGLIAVAPAQKAHSILKDSLFAQSLERVFNFPADLSLKIISFYSDVKSFNTNVEELHIASLGIKRDGKIPLAEKNDFPCAKRGDYENVSLKFCAALHQSLKDAAKLDKNMGASIIALDNAISMLDANIKARGEKIDQIHSKIYGRS